MATMQDLSKAQLAFQVAGGEPDEFLVQRFRGSEGLCQLYRFEIDLVTTLEDIEFDTIVGKPATLSVNTLKGTRWFHGIVSQLEMTGGTPGQDYYRAELVPAVWLLTQRYNSRIWQNKTVPEIVSDVLTQAGIPSDRVKKSLTGSHPPREYCVQYRETDYNLMCRLLEEEGIWWCFEQAQKGHFLVLADSVSAYTPLPGEDNKLPFVPPSGMNAEQEHVFHFRIGQSVRPGAVTLNDFNFEDPKLKLEAKSNAGRDAGFEFYDYPGEYNAGSRGGQLAKTRMEEFESARILAFGQSNSYRMAPSRVFEMIEHPSTPLNKKYLLTKVRHEGKEATTRTVGGGSTRSNLLQARVHELLVQARQNENETIKALAEGILEISMRLGNGDRSAHRDLTSWLYHAGQVSRDLASTAAVSGGHPLEPLALPNLIDDVARAAMVDYDAPVYECTFECIPGEVIYRPARVTPWPVMRGSQTARVVGPAGEEIYCDKYGRVKVQFHWDRVGKFDDKSSCWIRVSQGMAGGQYGMMFLPRVGQEVVVDFLEGDPDQPLITGRVFNGDHMPPYDLPKEKTKSTIKTRSTKGGGGTNEIRFEDLKGKEQILVYAQKDLHVRVKNDRVENVENDQHLTVDKNKFELVKQGKNSEVKLDLSEKVGGKKSLKVAGDVAEDFGGKHSEKVGMDLYLKAGMNVVIEAGIGLTLKVGGNFINIGPAGVAIQGTMVMINSGGAAGAGSAASLKAPGQPKSADTVQPGKDVTYSGGEKPPAAPTPGDVKGLDFPPDPIEEKKPSWVEIELVNEKGNPIPGEPYEVIGPDGKTVVGRGNLDTNGQARVSVPDPGNCRITFPKLDQDAWERM